MTPRLTDFGISRLASDSEAGRSSLLAGTPRYVAPELAEGLEATPAADLYSLGIVLYEMSCGVTPFAGGSMLTVIRQHAEQEPGRPGGIPDQLWEVISWLLRKSPRGRPQTAQQVATLLDALAPELLRYPVAQRLTAPPPPEPAQEQFTTQLGVARVPAGPLAPVPVLASSPTRRRRRTWFVTIFLVLAMVGGGAAYATLRPSGSAGQESTGQGGPGPVSTDVPAPRPTRQTTTTTTEEELTVAPDLVGMELADAQDQLPSTVDVEIVDSIQQGAEPGTVVAQDPEAGDRLDGTITITVARDAVQMYLDELQPVNGSWGSSEPASIAGKPYLHSLSTSMGCYSEGSQIEYNVAKGFRRLNATSALDDNSENAEATVQLEIFADGRSVFNGTIGYGTPTPIDLDLSGVLRLKFQWRPLQDSCESRTLVIGEAKLFGLPGEVPTTTPTS